MSKLIHKKKVLGALLVLILFTATVSIGVYDFGVKEGTLNIDGNKEQVKTNLNTVGELLKERKIEIVKEDSLSPSLDEELTEGFEVTVKKAVKVYVTLEGEKREILTSENTVKDALAASGIYYDQLDRVSPSLDEKIAPELEIEIVRVSEAFKSKEEEIPFETATKENADLEKGQTRVVQAGSAGLKVINIKETYENKALANTEIISESLEKEPVNEIIEKGTKELVAALPQPEKTVEAATRSSVRQEIAAPAKAASRQEPVQEASVQESPKAEAPKAESPKAEAVEPESPSGKGPAIMMNASAYDDSPQQNGGYVGITAMGTKLRPGVVAVDPKVIPLGTKVYIEYPDGTPWGYGTAEDTGGAIKGNKIDIFMKSGAMQFGRRTMKVYVVK